MRHRIGALIAAVLLPLTLLTNATPANATDKEFYACQDVSCPGTGETGGTIVWNNRTATLRAWLDHPTNATWYTTATYEAFAGTTKVDTAAGSVGPNVHLIDFPPFAIGDPNRVGGIDRIRITVCSLIDGYNACGDQYNFWR
ncbi:hypothetical protein [Kribbella sp. NPDC049584]|uniref:hypothetical protein n=1 Tax=Kribbella sp. NPDC049584 TaxID=3154833 RepID=UPI00343B0D1D